MMFWLSFGLLLFTLCVNAQYETGDIRLIGGSYQWEGRVEIYMSGAWGTIADSQWSSDDAQVVCRKLGHFTPGAVPKPGAYFGEGSGPIHMDYVSCTGTEYNLTDCSTRSNSRQTSHSDDVGVQCQPAAGSYQEGDIRLVDGSRDWEGRVEIFIAGTWGTISDDSWTTEDAEVVCRQLGHSTSDVVAQCCAYYGQGSGPVHLNNITCFGSEPNITNCSYSNTNSNDHQWDVGVHCEQASTVRPGTIRLVGGSFQWEGRVEVYLSGTWGTVSNPHGHPDEAVVVCRQLGYAGDSISLDCCHEVERGLGPIVMGFPECSGREYRLTSCTYDSSSSGKTHDWDWGVKCSLYSPEEGDIRLLDYDGHNSYGPVNMFVSGMWGHVARDSWNVANTKVVCRQLGYLTNGTFWNNVHIQSDPPNLIGDVSCTGSESRLVDCPHMSGENYRDYVTVACPIPDCRPGDFRLVEGQTEREGRVEMCVYRAIYTPGEYLRYQSVWGTVCGNQWTSTHTEILCRYLGFAEEGAYFGSSTFGQGSGPVFLNYIMCNGSENSILDCRYFSHSYGCTHTDDVGVRCEPAMCYDGQIRLQDGVHLDSWTGILEVCFNHRWGPVISTGTEDRPLAQVLCRQLGYLPAGGIGQHYSKTLEGGPKYIRDVRCFGTESNILDCSYSNYTGEVTGEHMIDAACQPVQCEDGEMRLTGGTEQEGRLEVCLDQRWGTVSSDGWTVADAQVVCRSLGYETNTDDYVFHPPHHAMLSSSVYLENVACSGIELTLFDCTHTNATRRSDHSNDVGVKCKAASCSDGDIRLVNGNNQHEGRLLICFNQRWGTVNYIGWSYVDSGVVCRQLGYSDSETEYQEDVSGVISSPIYINDVDCRGEEKKLTDCNYATDIDEYSAYHRYDVGVICYQGDGGTDDSEPPSTATSHTDSPSDHSDSPSGHTDSPSGHTDSPSGSSANSSNGAIIIVKDENSKDDDAKIAAALSVAVISLVVAALSLVVAGGAIICHCVSSRKKYGGYNEVPLVRRDSNDSITGIASTENKADAYATTTVETGTTALL